MIKFFRKIRYKLMSENKTGKYFKYAIGEIILVVIGILIALGINNWNESRKEKEQIKNILSRVMRDFNSNSEEISFAVNHINTFVEDIQHITTSSLNKDSLLYSNTYFNKYLSSFGGFEDIKINRDGVDLLKTKIQSNFDLNNTSTEELLKLYSESYYEVEIDEKDLIRNFINLSDYILTTGSHFENDNNNDNSKLIELLLDDKTFKIYLNEYNYALGLYRDKLESFQKKGKVVMEKIKVDFNL